MKNIKLFILSILCMCILSCGKDKDFKERERNPNIVDLEQGAADVVWLTDSTFCRTPLAIVTLDKNFKVIQTKQLGYETGICLSYNKEKNKMLYIQNGSLYEYDFGIDLVTTIFYKANITSAHYYKDDNIIYCANSTDSITQNVKINYFIYNQTTKEDSLILSTYIYSGTGFDVHPLKSKLVFYTNNSMIEFNIDSKKMDTLYTSPQLRGWFRYNPAGNKIAYSLGNSIEILDLTTMKRKVLNTNTSIYENDISSDKHPCWSPNGKNIIYSSMHYEGNDPGPYKLYILKNAN